MSKVVVFLPMSLLMVFACVISLSSAFMLTQFDKDFDRFCEGPSDTCLEPYASSFNCICPPQQHCVGSDEYFSAGYCRESWSPNSMVYLQGDSNAIYHAWHSQNSWDRFPAKKAQLQ
ncbi:uncharacterized protein LOC134839560 [Symsagittifera roscoffensis]|uniref:uncharacterized protein LOC134839560 n=1 Tax=Symsagittifera roscoffensis TaxID=84072 RepID=UPI00307C15C0